MPVAVNADAAARLLEALERSRMPQGEGLAVGHRGPVPEDLARAFRERMDAPEENLAAGAPQPAAAAGTPAEGVRPGGAAGFSGSSDLAADRVEGPGELALPTPEELLRTQFSLNMRLFESQTYSSVKDGVSSRAEEALRSSG